MLLFAAGAAAQDFRITHGPYLCDMTDDGVTVVWTTSAPALSWVEVAPADGRSFYAEEHPRYYETVAGRRQARKTLHTVRLRGLEPGTAYCYRIFSREVREWPHYDNVAYGAVASSNVFRRKPYTFRTFPESGAECRFLVLNDIHGQADRVVPYTYGVRFRQVMPQSEFQLIPGDDHVFSANVPFAASLASQWLARHLLATVSE